ncbi:MAG TPA: hypothetical protein VGG28_19770 [Kofleriaceae bacterium]|jgi:hypothetical protein
MKQLWLVVMLASCGKGGPAKTTADVFAGQHGVVVTATDVRVDGKSLGILPQRLATDRDALKSALVANKTELALAYTDDASGDAVLGALRGIEDSAAKPIAKPAADDSGGTAAAMALDEGKMGGGQYKMGGNRHPADTAEIAVTALVGGKPTEICRVATPPPVDPGDSDDEHVMLTLQIGHAQIDRVVSRLNDRATIHAADLDRDLNAQKTAAFFSDRDDIVLAAAPDATGADVTPVIATACKVGFREVRPASVAELTKRLGQK